jgi:hypothetical protein
MSIITSAELLLYLDSSDIVDDAELDANQATIESVISRYCRRTFEATSYVLERYSGNGTRILSLNNYPIISVSTLSVSTMDVMRIYNTSYGTFASVSVSPTALTLNLNGTDTSLLFSSYLTLTTLNTAINAQSGWSSEILDSNYSAFKTAFLLKKYGMSCIDSDAVYLTIPDRGESGFEVLENQGQIYFASGFTKGYNNIFVSHRSGYETASMPADLKLAVMMTVKKFYNTKTDSSLGLQAYRIGDVSYTFVDAGSTDATSLLIPPEALSILARYKKRKP